jgi:hypothetical protein
MELLSQIACQVSLLRVLIIAGLALALSQTPRAISEEPKLSKPAMRAYTYDSTYQDWKCTLLKVETPIGTRNVRVTLQGGDEHPAAYQDAFVTEIAGYLPLVKEAVHAALPEMDPRFSNKAEIAALRGPTITIEYQEPGKISRWLLHFEREHGKQVVVYTFEFNRKELVDTIIGVH